MLPQTSGLVIRILIEGEASHCLQVVVVIPALIRIRKLESIEEVLVEVESQGAMVLGKAVLPAIPGEQGLVLDRVPVVYRFPVQVCRHIRAQVEGVAFLSPDGKEVTAAGKDIRRGAGLEVGPHLLVEVLGVKGEEDADVGMWPRGTAPTWPGPSRGTSRSASPGRQAEPCCRGFP